MKMKKIISFLKEYFNLFHLMGLIIGNIAFIYSSTGIIGFNIGAFILSIFILVPINYYINKYTRKMPELNKINKKYI